MPFDNRNPKTAQLTKQNQQVCAEMYSNARKAKTDDEIVMWQNSAAYHFVKTAHRMNLLQPMMESCAYWHARVQQ